MDDNEEALRRIVAAASLAPKPPPTGKQQGGSVRSGLNAAGAPPGLSVSKRALALLCISPVDLSRASFSLHRPLFDE